MTKTILMAVLACVVAAGANDGWISMFDGKTLEGWKSEVNPESWSVRDGAIVGEGPKSLLYWMQVEHEDCEFKAEVKINDGGNSGIFFRKGFGPRGAKGYEAQINSTHQDPKKTGSLYNFQNIYENLVPPDTWFTLHVIARANHIIIQVNEKTVVDYVDEKNTYKKGFIALQQHHQGNVVMFRKLMMKTGM
jgi:hypothetical protein